LLKTFLFSKQKEPANHSDRVVLNTHFLRPFKIRYFRHNVRFYIVSNK